MFVAEKEEVGGWRGFVPVGALNALHILEEEFSLNQYGHLRLFVSVILFVCFFFYLLSSVSREENERFWFLLFFRFVRSQR